MSAFWYQAENVPGRPKAPAWVRRLAVDGAGRLFLPAILAASEMEVFLCAGYDGTPCIHDSGHLYVPADWMRQEFPKTAATVDRIVSTFSHLASEASHLASEADPT